ncbi:hypothetical protein BDR05DRAFT_476812 [Suillus weaverae]|nr:hypothetical protein BDR05DRAFT_476812 [Suillus weaverae]
MHMTPVSCLSASSAQHSEAAKITQDAAKKTHLCTNQPEQTLAQLPRLQTKCPLSQPIVLPSCSGLAERVCV